MAESMLCGKGGLRLEPLLPLQGRRQIGLQTIEVFKW
jgi:hypothetical protein